jgi:hypothetical protein
MLPVGGCRTRKWLFARVCRFGITRCIVRLMVEVPPFTVRSQRDNRYEENGFAC